MTIACNGNKSDSLTGILVLIQRPEYGGGTISFDGEVIRMDGISVTHPDLLGFKPRELDFKNLVQSKLVP